MLSYNRAWLIFPGSTSQKDRTASWSAGGSDRYSRRPSFPAFQMVNPETQGSWPRTWATSFNRMSQISSFGTDLLAVMLSGGAL